MKNALNGEKEMKTKKWIAIFAGLALSLVGMSVSAIPMGTVGAEDPLIGSGEQGEPGGPDSSGDADELEWVNMFLEPDVTYDSKLSAGSYSFELVDGTADTYAFLFALTIPEYFMVKTGNNKGTDDTHFLFQNIANLNYGVVDLSDLGIDNIGKFSHIGEFSPGEVPEPGILGLLGIGLLGMMLARRRRKTG